MHNRTSYLFWIRDHQQNFKLFLVPTDIAKNIESTRFILAYWGLQRSQRQIFPPSQTQIRMLPSREKAVCLIIFVHLPLCSVVQQDLAGSKRFSSHKNVSPNWFPSAMNLWLKSNEKRLNQNSQAMYSNRCTIEMAVSLLDFGVSSRFPGFQQIIEFSHDWNIME